MDNFLFKPKYTITDEILTLTANIAAKADVLTVQSGMVKNPKLRRASRIRTIHSSLAIENNSLSLEQVTAILDGRRVLAPPQDICEVQNAFQAYDLLLNFNPYDIMDLQAAHRILMKDLVLEPGLFRNGNIGVVRGEEVLHIAPPPDNVSGLMADLLCWTEGAPVHPLIKSCVFHYEFEFVHPFSDGNGRMGRMWQTLLLYKWKDIFAWLPVETVVYDRQEKYYTAIGKSNDADDCTEFIQFMLQAIWDALEMYSTNDQDSDQVSDQVKRLLEVLGADTHSAAALMGLLNLKHRPTFRKNYLHPAINQGLIEMTKPDTPNSRNQSYRRKI